MPHSTPLDTKVFYGGKSPRFDDGKAKGQSKAGAAWLASCRYKHKGPRREIWRGQAPQNQEHGSHPRAEQPRCERSVTTAATQNINTGAGTSCLYLLLADRNTAVMTLINTPRSSAGWSTVHLLVRCMRTRARQCWRLPVTALWHLRSHHRPPPPPHATCLK